MCVLWCEDGKKIHILWSKNNKILKKSIRNCKSTTFHYNDESFIEFYQMVKKQKTDRGMKEKTNKRDKQTDGLFSYYIPLLLKQAAWYTWYNYAFNT